jgi:hypothetical protein
MQFRVRENPDNLDYDNDNDNGAKNGP